MRCIWLKAGSGDPVPVVFFTFLLNAFLLDPKHCALHCVGGLFCASVVELRSCRRTFPQRISACGIGPASQQEVPDFSRAT